MLGTALNVAFLRAQQEIAYVFHWSSVYDCGEYGNPPNCRCALYIMDSCIHSLTQLCRIWLIQLLSWLGILLLSKMIILAMLVTFAATWGGIGEILFHSLRPYPLAELVVVLIVCPSFLNVVQLWIQDTFLKKEVEFSPKDCGSLIKENSLKAKLLANV